MAYGIEAQVLRTRFGETVALDGFDLAVETGSVCGLLGPNGAGKTTAVRTLATLTRLQEGQASVAGFDVATQPARVRGSIGVVGQHAAVDEVLSGRENLEMFGRLFHLGRAAARRRADELLERFDLQAAGRRPAGEYSGGMRRRLDLAAGLVLSPPVLFLDEPTTGLDPRGRSEMWQAVRSLVGAGTTVLLTTQYLEEADQLADRITVIDHGRAIAEGTPSALKNRLGGERLDVVVTQPGELPLAAELLRRVSGATPELDDETLRASAPVADPVAALTELVRALDDASIRPEDVALRRPTLDEVFLALTDRDLEVAA